MLTGTLRTLGSVLMVLPLSFWVARNSSRQPRTDRDAKLQVALRRWPGWVFLACAATGVALVAIADL